MNVSHLTNAELCKALADAAEFNEEKVRVKREMSSMFSARNKARVDEVIGTHARFALLCRGECRRLQKGGA
jgi:histidinol-phosphate/aromatic aminotransferase/cobyric acid decarboxylase-like protein